MTLTKTVPRLAKGEKATVDAAAQPRPPLDTPVHDLGLVNKVPGEKKTDNNKVDVPVAVRPQGPSLSGRVGFQ